MTRAERDSLRTALQDLPLPAGLTELATGRLVRVNEEAAQLMGEPAGAYVGTDVVSYIHPDDRAALTRAHAALADGTIDGYQVERRPITPSGTELRVAARVRRVEGPAGPYALWIFIPVADGGSPGPLSNTDRLV